MMNRMWMMVGRGKFFLIFGLSLLFGLSERGSAQGLLPFHLLAVLNDQYYFVFAVLPVFLFLCTCVMEDDMLFVLVRYGTYGRYFFRKWRALSVIAVFFWLVQMAALLCSGLGLPIAGSWPGAPAGQWKEVFTLLQGYFPSPWAAVLCCAGQMLLGYWLIALTALCLGHFCSRFLAVKLLLALYLFAALWIKLPVMSQPPFVFLTGFNHWVFLLHNLAEPWRLPLTAVTTAIVTMGMVWLVTRRWYWRFSVSIRGKKGLGPYYRRVLFTGKNGLLLAGLIFLLTAWTWISGGVPEDSTDWLIRLFAGHGTGSFYPSPVAAGGILHAGYWGTLRFSDNPPAAEKGASGGDPLYRASLDTSIWMSAYSCGCRSAPAVGLFTGYRPERNRSGAEAFGRWVSIPADPVGLMRDGAGDGRVCDRCTAAFSLCAARFMAPGRAFQSGAAEPSADGRNHAGSGCSRAAGDLFPGPAPLAFRPGY